MQHPLLENAAGTQIAPTCSKALLSPQEPQQLESWEGKKRDRQHLAADRGKQELSRLQACQGKIMCVTDHMKMDF